MASEWQNNKWCAANNYGVYKSAPYIPDERLVHCRRLVLLRDSTLALHDNINSSYYDGYRTGYGGQIPRPMYWEFKCGMIAYVMGYQDGNGDRWEDIDSGQT